MTYLKKINNRIWNSPALMTWGSVAVKTLGLALLLPLVLAHFPKEDVVVWQLFATIIILQMLVDMGFSPTFSRIIAYCMAGRGINSFQSIRELEQHTSGESLPDWVSIHKIVIVMHSVYQRLLIVSFFITGIVGTYAISGSIILSSDPDKSWYAWGVVVIAAMFQLYGNLYSSYLQGVNAVAIQQRWQMLISLCAVLSASFTLIAGGDILSLAVAYQIWPILNVAVNAYLKKRVTLEKSDSFISPEEENQIKRAIWPSVWRSGVGILMSAGLVQGSGLVYANLGESAEVASYLLGLQLIRVISSFSQAPFYSKIPVFSRKYALHDVDGLLSLAKRGMQLTYVIYITGFFMGGALGDWLLNMIGSDVLFPDKLLWSVLGLGIFVERFGAMHIQLYSSTNHIIWHIANGISGLLMILFGIVFYFKFNVMTFPYAILFGYSMFYCWYAALHTYKEFSIGFFDFEKKVGLPALLAMIVCIMLFQIGARV